MKSCNTLQKPWSSANIPCGPSKRFKTKILTVPGRMIVPTATTRRVIQHKTPMDSLTAQKKGPRRKNPSIGHIVIPYTQELGGSFKKMCGKYGIQTLFKGNRTLKQLLVKPKDQESKEKESGVIYNYQCVEIA